MLQTEQAAAEWMFSHEKAKLIFATGTLAQGLNLPAIAVVIAGTSMGDPRAVDTDSPAGISRVNALILNGFGRAGRPGFSNQGIGVLVSDSPFSAPISDDLDPVEALNRYSVLGEPDATVNVQSPLESFIDKLLADEPLESAASEEELVLASSLAEFNDDDNNAGLVLSRTFAAYCKRETFLPQTPEQLRARLVELKEAYLQHPAMPQWMNTVAMKAGVQFIRAWRMYSAYMQRGVPAEDEAARFGVMEWLQVFFEVMSLMPPEQIAVYLPDESVKRVTVLTRMRDRVPRNPSASVRPWPVPANWPRLWRELMELVSLYMKGSTYAELARVYLQLPAGDIGNQRTKGDHPIPAVFKFLSDVISKLSVDAGCFLAIHELVVNGSDKTRVTIPDTLQALPLCIRNGCDSLGVLAWYRFAYRQRVCAHALQRAFPVPGNLKNDAEIWAWVSQARRTWLAGERDVSEEPLLAHARVVITEASQN